MLTINRRRIMVSAATGLFGAMLSGALPGLAAAQAAVTARGNAGHYRFRIGDIVATVLSDGIIGGPPSVYAGNAPELELQEALRRLSCRPTS